MEFKPGQRVKVVQQGTLKIGSVTLTDNIFEGVTVLGKNPDGTYRVSLRGIIDAPGLDDVTVPAEWIHPL
jgi:hypothetical protein